MTRKDYIRLAAALRAARPEFVRPPAHDNAGEILARSNYLAADKQWLKTVQALADTLGSDLIEEIA